MIEGPLATILLTHVVPSVGCVASNAVAFSSLTKILEIRRTKRLETFDPTPLAFSLLSGISQLFYSYACRNYYVFAGTLPGFLLMIFSVLTVLGAKDLFGARRSRMDFTLLLGISALFIMGFVVHVPLGPGGLLFDATQFAEADRLKATVLGYQGIFFLCMFMMSPLSVVFNVLRERNSVYFFLPLAVTSLLSSLLWGTYGLVIGDVFVYGPNVFGITLALVQIACCLVFPRFTPPTMRRGKGSGNQNKHDSNDEHEHDHDDDDDDDTNSDVRTLGSRRGSLVATDYSKKRGGAGAAAAAAPTATKNKFRYDDANSKSFDEAYVYEKAVLGTSWAGDESLKIKIIN